MSSIKVHWTPGWPDMPVSGDGMHQEGAVRIRRDMIVPGGPTDTHRLMMERSMDRPVGRVDLRSDIAMVRKSGPFWPDEPDFQDQLILMKVMATATGGAPVAVVIEAYREDNWEVR